MLVVLSHVKSGVLLLVHEPVSTALHRFHSVTSDFRPPSVTESGEAALQSLLASCAILLPGR